MAADGAAALWFFGAEASKTATRLVPMGFMIIALMVAAIAVQPTQPQGERIPVEPTAARPSTEEFPAPTATPPTDNTFHDYGVNPFIDTNRDHLSTFGLDVDTPVDCLAGSLCYTAGKQSRASHRRVDNRLVHSKTVD